jgi:hypothetical protein
LAQQMAAEPIAAGEPYPVPRAPVIGRHGYAVYCPDPAQRELLHEALHVGRL